MVSSDAVEVRNFPTFSYIAVIFKSLFFVAHKFPGHNPNDTDKSFYCPRKIGYLQFALGRVL